MTETKNEELIDRFEKHIEHTKAIRKYSIERFDLLIISLSTAAIGFSVVALKDLLPISRSCFLLAKVSWLLFVISIIGNLVSQLLSFNASGLEIEVSTNRIRELKQKKSKINIEETDKLMQRQNKVIVILNYVCLASFITGLILILIFVFINV